VPVGRHIQRLASRGVRLRRDERYLDRAATADLRTDLETALADVHGWLWLDEGCALSEAARRARPDGEPLVVEIGSWLGRSTICLARGLARRRSPGGRVVAIDPHSGSKEHDELWPETGTFGRFLENLRRAGVEHLVEPCRTTSHEARRTLGVRDIDVLFIDGSHEYPDVCRDLDDWLPLLAPGAVVALNDVVWPGVLRALLGTVLRRGSHFAHPAIFDNTLFLTYLGRDRPTRADRRRMAAFRIELVLRFLLHKAMTARQAWAERRWDRRSSKPGAPPPPVPPGPDPVAAPRSEEAAGP
jgi:predicted O-methyltransferase YrrM